ncbi:amino acid ABC transporter substrate-binding protein [Thalassospira sp. HF15]|uniref:substrate-binding periplasmic protein n=1 Tax=Thalassospira sp. HF15 TaxID=2722755 RepID=UPI00143027BB|nr:transporter substrate-binding domain-containing protein [Thalassospira sp. HF15]NIY75403.1 amino acid ABC transporter substrate-binding protein [Thalassospira sp. HF15]
MLIGHALLGATLAAAQTVQNSNIPRTITLYAEDSNKPYAFLDGTTADGIYVRILQEAFDRMPGYRLDIVSVPFRRGMDLLENGAIMGFFPPYERADRSWIERYSIPILRETVVAICSKDYAHSNELNRFPDDFKGARFANNAGYRLAGPEFFDMVDAGDITLEEANTTASNLRFLMAGRVDCYVNERMAILAAMQELDVDRATSRLFDEVAIIGHEFGYVAFGPDPEDYWPYRDQFADDLDQVLRDMRDSGEIDRLVVSYFAY